MTKKRIMILLLVAALLLCAGCSNRSAQEEAVSTPEPTAEPQPTAAPAPSEEPEEPETVPGTVRADSYGVVYSTLKRGDTFAITGEDGSYYVVDLDGEKAYIEKRLLRPDRETVPESTTVYAAVSKLEIYDNPYFEGDSLATASFNEKLELIDYYGSLALVEKDGVQGYVKLGSLSNQPISYGNGGNDGDSEGEDGGDIQLSARFGMDGRVVRLADGGTGTVFADHTELYLALLKSGDTVKVTEYDDETCTILVGKKTGTAPRWLIALEGDSEYEAWDGYAFYNARVYEDHRMLTDGRPLGLNTPVRVLWDLGDEYLVSVGGELGYMEASKVTETETQVTYSAPEETPEWTEPVL